jgi:hypothetical protein
VAWLDAAPVRFSSLTSISSLVRPADTRKFRWRSIQTTNTAPMTTTSSMFLPLENKAEPFETIAHADRSTRPLWHDPRMLLSR